MVLHIFIMQMSKNLTLKNRTVSGVFFPVLTFVLLAKVLAAYPCVICLLGIANKIL